MGRRFITTDEAIRLLPEGEEIHTFIANGMVLIGADWSRDDIIEILRTADHIEITGPHARGMKHGIAVWDDTAKYESDIRYIETDTEKLDEFDPVQEEED